MKNLFWGVQSCVWMHLHLFSLKRHERNIASNWIRRKNCNLVLFPFWQIYLFYFLFGKKRERQRGREVERWSEKVWENVIILEVSHSFLPPLRTTKKCPQKKKKSICRVIKCDSTGWNKIIALKLCCHLRLQLCFL